LDPRAAVEVYPRGLVQYYLSPAADLEHPSWKNLKEFEFKLVKKSRLWDPHEKSWISPLKVRNYYKFVFLSFDSKNLSNEARKE